MVATKAKEPIVEKEAPIFQAIGVVTGKVTFESGVATILLGGRQYKLLRSKFGRSRREYPQMERNVFNGKAVQTLVVYPLIRDFDENGKPKEIAFTFVGIVKKPPGLANNEFKLCGFWQRIPRSVDPCISVKRNLTKDTLKLFLRQTSREKMLMAKGLHIPIQWKDPFIEPFRYNPEKPDENPLFLSIKAIFDPKSGKFTFAALLAMPQVESPKYLKKPEKLKKKKS